MSHLNQLIIKIIIGYKLCHYFSYKKKILFLLKNKFYLYPNPFIHYLIYIYILNNNIFTITYYYLILTNNMNNIK